VSSDVYKPKWAQRPKELGVVVVVSLLRLALGLH
jgi:hypothetical protein